MPGRSSSSSSRSSFSRSSKPSSSYSYSSPKSPVPAPPAPTTPIQHNVQVQQPGFFSNMWQGFGLGAGQSIAMNIFRSNPTVTHIHENISSKSSNISSLEASLPKEYVQCMKESDNNKEACKQYLE